MNVALRRLIPCLIAALIALLALPATGQAGVQIFGSDLSAPADVIEHHGADSAFWNVKLGNGGTAAAPADGQVTEVRVKGNVLDDPRGQIKPMTMMHFQVLHPMGDGSVKVMLSSGAFYTPLGGDSQQINTYAPVNLCVHKGDYVDFNDIGGNQNHWGRFDGMPFRTFIPVPGSIMNFNSDDNGTYRA